MTKLRAALLGATMIAGACLVTPAWAIAVAVPAFELSSTFTQTSTGSCAGNCYWYGYFTVTNNTTQWWITGLDVSGITADQGVQAQIGGNSPAITPPIDTAWRASDNGCAVNPSDTCTGNFLGYLSNSPGALGDDLGHGTFTGLDFNLYDSQPIYGSPVEPPATFDITNGNLNLTCNFDFTFGSANAQGCDPPATGVPEPGMLSLFGAGLAFLGAIRRRRKPAKG
jgi:PEP-CTERM motif-containing protein